MKVSLRKYLVVGGVGIVVVVALLYWVQPSAPIVQPISFNHKAHPLACTFCHQSVQRRAAAGRPALKTCATCHQAMPPRTEPMRVLKTYIDQKKEVPWVRIYRLPKHVYFSHRRHVGVAKLSCQTCHGKVQQFTEPAPRPVWEPTMDNCLACHRQKNASVDCNSCHR